MKKLATWSSIAALLSIVMGRAAVWLQAAGFSTIVLFPIFIGAALGATIALVASQFGEMRRALVVIGCLLAATICAAAEHGFFYLDYRSNFAAKLQSDPKTQLAATMNPGEFQPASFSRFMAAAAGENWPLWIVDASAMIAATGTTAWLVFPSGKSPAKSIVPPPERL